MIQKQQEHLGLFIRLRWRFIQRMILESEIKVQLAALVLWLWIVQGTMLLYQKWVPTCKKNALFSVVWKFTVRENSSTNGTQACRYREAVTTA